MTALVGGGVEGNVSAIVGLLTPFAQADEAAGEDLADLGKPLGGGHQVGVEGVVHRSATEARHSGCCQAGDLTLCHGLLKSSTDRLAVRQGETEMS
jgi:hypothetical protein